MLSAVIQLLLPHPFSWVEDKIVADRLKCIWENIKSLVKHWESKPKSKRPSTKSYENLKAAVDDPLATANLQLFLFVAGILQPFFKLYQTDQPMIPFMYNDIFTLLQKILQSVVKQDLLVNCKNFSDLLKLDLIARIRF